MMSFVTAQALQALRSQAALPLLQIGLFMDAQALQAYFCLMVYALLMQKFDTRQQR